MRLSSLLFAIVMIPSLASAETREAGSFSISIRGFPFGSIAYSAAERGSAYSVAARVEASGLIGALVRARYDAQAQGTIRSGRYIPQRYTESARRGRRETESVLSYRNGVPGPKQQTPPQNPRPSDIDPAKQGGTVDPATAIFTTLRDMPRETACQVDLAMYDGRYRAGVTLGNPEPKGDGLVCTGMYRRLAGYSDAEMAEGSAFPFTAELVPHEGKMRIQRIVMDTLYGTARVERR